MKTLLLSDPPASPWSALYDSNTHMLLVSDEQHSYALPHIPHPTCLRWSVGGQYLALAHGWGIDLFEPLQARLHIVRTSSPQPTPADRILSLAFSPHSTHLAVGMANGEVEMLWINGQVCWKQGLSPSPITHLAWEPCGKYIASSNLDGGLVLWDASTGTVELAWESPLVVSELKWTPSTFLVKHQGRTVQISSPLEKSSSSGIWEANSG